MCIFSIGKCNINRYHRLTPHLLILKVFITIIIKSIFIRLRDPIPNLIKKINLILQDNGIKSKLKFSGVIKLG